jgi:hypothetical protein
MNRQPLAKAWKPGRPLVPGKVNQQKVRLEFRVRFSDLISDLG